MFFHVDRRRDIVGNGTSISSAVTNNEILCSETGNSVDDIKASYSTTSMGRRLRYHPSNVPSNVIILRAQNSGRGPFVNESLLEKGPKPRCKAK